MNGSMNGCLGYLKGKNERRIRVRGWQIGAERTFRSANCQHLRGEILSASRRPSGLGRDRGQFLENILGDQPHLAFQNGSDVRPVFQA